MMSSLGLTDQLWLVINNSNILLSCCQSVSQGCFSTDQPESEIPAAAAAAARERKKMEMTTPVFSAPRSTSGTNSDGASMQFVIEKKMGGEMGAQGKLQCSMHHPGC
jgi:hypothetical protein